MSAEFEALMARLESCSCESHSCDCGSDCRCEEVWEQLFTLLDAQVPHEVSVRLLSHGRNCATCRAKIEEELAMRKVIRRGCYAEEAPASLRQKIAQLINSDDGTPGAAAGFRDI